MRLPAFSKSPHHVLHPCYAEQTSNCPYLFMPDLGVEGYGSENDAYAQVKRHALFFVERCRLV